MGPAEYSIEYRPALSVQVIFGVTTIQMPDVSLDGVCSWSISSCIVDIWTDKDVERVSLKGTDGLAE